jgi:hypothetical protein
MTVRGSMKPQFKGTMCEFCPYRAKLAKVSHSAKNAVIKKGIKVLSKILRDLRWNDQGGYVSYLGKGKWAFVSTGLPQTKPAELNALFAMCGIEPDVIKIKGDCDDCAHSVNGREQGYKGPCLTCLRPSHINNFKPMKKKA